MLDRYLPADTVGLKHYSQTTEQ